MTINQYTKKWCNEDYDVRKESFFVDHAKYTVRKEWVIGGLKHGVFATIIGIAMLVILFGRTNSLVAYSWIATVVGALTACFWFYGIREYDANSMETSKGAYLLAASLLVLLLCNLGEVFRICLTIPSFAMYVYFTFVNPIGFINVARTMKQRIMDEAKEEDEAAKNSYAGWESGYKAYRYGLPNADIPQSDPVMNEAKALFNGYCESMQSLKTRYRQLAKQYHPDKGGDTKLFQCIIEVYENLSSKFAN